MEDVVSDSASDNGYRFLTLGSDGKTLPACPYCDYRAHLDRYGTLIGCGHMQPGAEKNGHFFITYAIRRSRS